MPWISSGQIPWISWIREHLFPAGTKALLGICSGTVLWRSTLSKGDAQFAVSVSSCQDLAGLQQPGWFGVPWLDKAKGILQNYKCSLSAFPGRAEFPAGSKHITPALQQGNQGTEDQNTGRELEISRLCGSQNGNPKALGLGLAATLSVPAGPPA